MRSRVRHSGHCSLRAWCRPSSLPRRASSRSCPCPIWHCRKSGPRCRRRRNTPPRARTCSESMRDGSAQTHTAPPLLAASPLLPAASAPACRAAAGASPSAALKFKTLTLLQSRAGGLNAPTGAERTRRRPRRSLPSPPLPSRPKKRERDSPLLSWKLLGSEGRGGGGRRVGLIAVFSAKEGKK